ncbi:hypothetical protein MLD38_033984 [Melastoma candidum]|uniref:Uncharacterized protein n=1 Tax=Melastoma candidum TaxID=119954 RepID=A0ACB9M8G6_9MYRT|nr:hypothetical protein MLD38_033984 [Melastoma candidum]
MDSEEADLPPFRSSTSTRSLVPATALASPAAALPSLSSSGTSAASAPSSHSQAGLLRDVQAAFKRHRRLGVKQSNDIRPRRAVAPTGSLAPGAGARRFRDSPALGRLGKKKIPDAETVMPSFPGMETKSFDESFNPFDVRMDQASCDIDWKEKDLPPVNDTEPLGSSSRKVQVSMQGNITSQGPYAHVATEPGNLSSYFSSLALTEIEFDSCSQVEGSTVINQDLQRQKLLTVESDVISKSYVNMPTTLSQRTAAVQDKVHQLRNFLNQPSTQSSVAGLSCVTTTSVHSSAAPMSSSTTCYSHLNQEDQRLVTVKTLGDPSPRLVKQENMMKLPTTSVMTTSEMVVDEPALASHNSSSYVGDKSEDKKVNVCKEPSSMKEERALKYDVAAQATAGVASSEQSKVPLSGDSSLIKKPGPALPGKDENATNRTGTSVPRKRNYDPDLFFKVNGKLYQKLGKIGSGGSSEVHKVISSDCTIYALKKIKLKGRDYATAYGFCQEIEYLNKLKGKNNIIQLIDYEVTDKTLQNEVRSGSMNIKDGRVKEDGFIYMVLEYGEIDLALMLSQKWKEMESLGQMIDENWLRFYWQQILQAVRTIHEERIVHSDLKPANFLLVKGSLKLIDFGIAKAIMSDTTNIQRESQVGTLSYMSPEAFMCNEQDANGNVIKCGRPSDIWSLGCILYQMVYGRTPFSEYKTFWSKFKVITDPNHEIVYGPISNPWLLNIMKKCLAWDRNKRWRIPQLLSHPFLAPLQSYAAPPSHEEEGCTLLVHLMSDASTFSTLLKESMEGPLSVSEVESLASQDGLCSLLSEVSRLCLELRGRVRESRRQQ